MFEQTADPQFIRSEVGYRLYIHTGRETMNGQKGCTYAVKSTGTGSYSDIYPDYTTALQEGEKELKSKVDWFNSPIED